MRINVINLIGVQPRVAQGVAHATQCARAVLSRCSNVVGVSAHAVACEFAVDACAARFGVFVFFEHHYTGAFADDKAIAIFIPRAAGGCGVVVARGQCARGAKPANAQR